MSDKDIGIHIKTTADIKSAKDVRDVLANVEDRIRKIENEASGDGLQKRIKAVRKLADETQHFAEIQDGAFEEGSAAAEDFKTRLLKIERGLDSAEQEFKHTNSELGEYVEKADAAAKKMGDMAEKAVKLGDGLGEIKLAQQIQLTAQFADGLGALSGVARKSGNKELADDLGRAAAAMKIVAGLAAGGMNLNKIVQEAGGAREALGRVKTFLAGPMGIALIGATAAWAAFQVAVKNANDKMDKIISTNAKSIFAVKDSAELEQAVREQTTRAIEAQTESVQDLHAAEQAELRAVRARQRVDIAKTDAQKAIDLALVDKAENSRELSEIEAIQARSKIENEALENRIKINSQARDEALEAIRKSNEDTKRLLESATAALTQAQEKSSTRRAPFTDKERTEFKDLTQKKRDEQAAVNDAESKGVPTGIGQANIAKIDERIIDIVKTAEKRANKELRGGQTLEEVRASIKGLREEHEKATAAYTKAAEKLALAKEKLETDNQVENIRANGESTTREIRTGERVANAASNQARSSGSEVVKEVRELGNDVVETLESSGAAKEVIAKAREDSKAANKLVADAFKDGIIDAGESQKIAAAVDGFRRQQASFNQVVANALAEATSAIAQNVKTIEGLRGQLRTVSSSILSR